METATKKKVLKILKIVGNVLAWAFVVFSVCITVLVFATKANDGVPSIGNKCVIYIVSDSMKPVFKSGDLIIGAKLTDEQKLNLQEGDIITFHETINGKDELNTHRIVEVAKDGNGSLMSYTTQGDNREMSPVPDKPIGPAEIVSQYTGTRVAGLGGFLAFLNTQLGFFLLIILPLIAFFIYELIRFILVISAVKGSKAKDKGSISEAEEAAIKQKAIEEYLAMQMAANNAQNSDNDAKAEDTSKDTADAEEDNTENNK